MEQLRVCKKFRLKGNVEGRKEEYWFPAFRLHPRDKNILLIRSDAKRIVKRRFKLEEDFIFLPGYFADLYISIAGLCSDYHYCGMWSDGMSFETSYIEGGREYMICVCIFIVDSHYFDLVVYSSNPTDRVMKTCDKDTVSPRVWNWLMQTVGFVYDLNNTYCSGILVKEECLHPLDDRYAPRDLYDAWKDRNSGQPIPRMYYYGSCGTYSATEEATREEALVFAKWTELEMVEVRRECHLTNACQDNPNKPVEDRIKPMQVEVQAVQHSISSACNCAPYSEITSVLANLSESVHQLKANVAGLAKENHTQIQNELRKITAGMDGLRSSQHKVCRQITDQQKVIGGVVNAMRQHQVDELNCVHAMPLCPVFTAPVNKRSSFTKTKQRMNFICPICLKKSSGTGIDGHGYKVDIQKEWYTNYAPYFRTVLAVLSIGLKVACIPADVTAVLGDVCSITDAVLRDAVKVLGEHSDSVQQIAESCRCDEEPSFEVDCTQSCSSSVYVDQESSGKLKGTLSPLHIGSPRGAHEEKGEITPENNSGNTTPSVHNGANQPHGDVYSPMQGHILEVNKVKILKSSTGDIVEARFPIILPQRSTSELAMLLMFIRALDECGSGPPERTGLQRVSCKWEGSSTWCCNACKDEFEKKGLFCQKIIYQGSISGDTESTTRSTF